MVNPRFTCAMLSALLSPFMAAQATLISDVGCGLPGTMGASEHTVLEDGGYLHFRVDNVPPESQVVLVVGLSAIWLPIFGGIVVPSPDALVEVTANSQGRAVFHMPIPSMHNLTIFSQYGFEDDGAPMGIALSNAVMVVASECSDIMCPRTPNQTVALDVTPATTELAVQFKLTGGNSGFCPSETCTSKPCEWVWTFIVDNQTAGPNANDPGIGVTLEVRSSLTGAAQSGLTEQVFQAASPLDPPVLLTVPNTHPKQVQKSFKESRECGGRKYYLIKISHPAYTYTVPGSPSTTTNVPAAQYYSIIELACGNGC